MAVASFSSGKLLTLAGWSKTINLMIFPVVVLCLSLLAWFVATRRGGRLAGV